MLPQSKWETATSRFEAIRPLLESEKLTAASVNQRAAALRLHQATLYRWLRIYQAGGTMSALLPHKSGARAGQRRLSPEVEAIIDAVIADRYLTKQRRKSEQIAREILLRCRRAGFEAPHPTTVRRRIARIPEQVKVEKRIGKRTAQQRFNPIPGAFPGTDYPLQVIQIDHTPLDIILVDDLHRLPIGRAWLTLAIDVFSRMVAGFYTSFDPPGALSVGLCLVHAILPKDLWLAKYGIHTKWPIAGIMDTVHCDNAKEFRGNMLERATANYGIQLQFRPVKKPQYGGHIERLLGTFAQEIHSLPGNNILEFG
jgi:putative transposase